MNVTRRKQIKSQFQPVGRWIRVDKRLAIYLRDRFTCVYCLRDLHDADPRDVSLDHVVAKSDGGSNRADNLVTACRSCNCSRGDKPLRRFCGPETRKHIRRNLSRDLKPYRIMAKAILSGKLEFDRDLIK